MWELDLDHFRSCCAKTGFGIQPPLGTRPKTGARDARTFDKRCSSCDCDESAVEIKSDISRLRVGAEKGNKFLKRNNSRSEMRKQRRILCRFLPNVEASRPHIPKPKIRPDAPQSDHLICASRRSGLSFNSAIMMRSATLTRTERSLCSRSRRLASVAHTAESEPLIDPSSRPLETA